MDPYLGQEILGQFRIIEKLGQGGMSTVYKAEQPSMDRLVAVKILHPRLATRPDLVTRFKREARAMSRLTHPNTVRVFLYGELEMGGALYIVMEYLDGPDLMRVLRKEGPFEVSRAARVISMVCGALEEAHNMAIVHRDLKPENIVLTTQGGIRDFPKVLDFGLAKIRDLPFHPVGGPILTQQGMVFGTPEFMSPEQAQGLEMDRRTDIYSLGVIFYELITGKLPFSVRSPMDYVAHHIKTPPIPIHERAPERKFGPLVWPVIARSLEKDPNRRYQTASEFAAALAPLIDGAGTHLVVSFPQPPTSSLSTVPTSPRHPAVRPAPSATIPLAGAPAGPQQVQAAPPVEMSPPQPGVSRNVVFVLVFIIVLLLVALIVLFVTRSPHSALDGPALPCFARGAAPPTLAPHENPDCGVVAGVVPASFGKPPPLYVPPRSAT